MERLFRFFGFRRSEPPKQEAPASSSEPDNPVPPSIVPTPVPVKKLVPPPSKLPSTNKSKEVIPCKAKESHRSRETVDRPTTGSKEKRPKSKPKIANRSKEQRPNQQTGSKESPRKRLSKEKPAKKITRISSTEKVTRISTAPVPPIVRKRKEMSGEESNEKTTEVDPNKTLASEAEKRMMTEKSEIEKRQTGVKKERTSMRRRMKEAALASSRQIRRASNSLTDSAKKFSNFVSRPIKERSLNNFMERVEQRKERRLKQNSDSMQLRESEDAFPTMSGAVCADKLVETPGIPSERSERTGTSERSEKEKRKIGRKDADKIFPDLGKEKKKTKSGSGSGSKASKRSLLSGRRRKKKDNELFVNGRPFWMRAGKITQEEKNEITQDDLPLNAEVIVDVKNGKIELPVLPSIPFKFDEYASMETLRERDKIFFTHKMLFANTIRSMINTAETESKTDTDTNTLNTEAGEEKTVENNNEWDEDKKSHRVELLPHPKYCTSYNRALPTGKMHHEPYEWTGKGVV